MNQNEEKKITEPAVSQRQTQDSAKNRFVWKEDDIVILLKPLPKQKNDSQNG